MTLQNWMKDQGRLPDARASDPQLAAICERILDISEGGYGAEDVATVMLQLNELVGEYHLTRRTLVNLGGHLARAGRYAQASAFYRQLLLEHPDARDGANYCALASVEACNGDLEAAVADLRTAFFLEREPTTNYQLGSCLALLGRFDEANQIFRQDIRIPLYENRSTSTRVIRLAEHRKAISPASPNAICFERTLRLDLAELTQNVDLSACDMIQFISCDSRYFSLFARAVCRSVAERSAIRMAMHFHIVNPLPADLTLVEELRREFDLPIMCSSESAVLDGLSSEQMKTIYSCVRYLVLSDLLEFYNKPILVTDADQVVVGDLNEFVASAKSHDVNLLMLPTGRDNFLALISASVCVFNATANAKSFAAALRNYLVDRLSDADNIEWHLDQAALAVVCLASKDIDINFLSPSILKSTLRPKPPNPRSPDQDTLFLSATFSLEGNAYKLQDEEFR